MYLWHIFLVKPLAALAILLCLTTILSCVLLERKRPHYRADRFLIAFLGLLSVYQGMRVLQSAGIVAMSSNHVDDAIEVAVTGFCLLATLVLRLATMDHLNAESALRLLRAAPPRSQPRNPEIERDLARLNWALPRLSDGAFRLYVYLCLRQEPAAGRISPGDVRVQLGKSKEELERDLAELERSGAVQISREAAHVGITIVAQPGASGILPPMVTASRAPASIPESVA